MFRDWSPTWDTQPQITSSTALGSIPDRETTSERVAARRSVGCQSASLPPRLPIGVRTASTITASGIAAHLPFLPGLPSNLRCPATPPGRDPTEGEKGNGGQVPERRVGRRGHEALPGLRAPDQGD